MLGCLPRLFGCLSRYLQRVVTARNRYKLLAKPVGLFELPDVLIMQNTNEAEKLNQLPCWNPGHVLLLKYIWSKYQGDCTQGRSAIGT